MAASGIIRTFCGQAEGCVLYMKKSRVFALLFAALVCLSVFTVSVGAIVCSPAGDNAVSAKITTKSSSADGVTVEYDVYNSPAYDPTDDSKASTVVLCFAEEGERFSRLFSLLLSDDADSAYKDYVYTAINLRLPSGYKWVDISEDDGYFSAKVEPTAAMKVVSSVVADIMAVGFPAEKTVVCGVGSGGTAAWYFACRNPKIVSHIMSIGACMDPDSIEGLRDANIRSLAYVGKVDTLRFQAHQSFSSNATTLEYSGFTIKEESLNYDGCIERVLNHEDEPSVTDWLVKNSYQTQFFTLSSTTQGKGGSITPTQKVFYGNSGSFTITLEPEFFIQELHINGKKTELAKLVPVDENKFSYTFANVTANGSISVSFGQKSYGFFDADTLLTVGTVLAAVFALAALGTYLFRRYAPARKN